MDRPKRMITKPSRYVTTSSDEASKRKKTVIGAAIETTIGDIQDDIDDLRDVLHREDNYNENPTFFNNNNNYTSPRSLSHTSHVPSCTNTHTTQADTQLHINIQPHPNIQSQANIQSYRDSDEHTNLLTYTNTSEPYTNLLQTHKNIQPYTSIPAQNNFQSYTSTNISATNISHALPTRTPPTHINYTPQTKNKTYTNTNLNTGNEFQSFNVSSRSSNESNVHHPAEEERPIDRYSEAQLGKTDIR